MHVCVSLWVTLAWTKSVRDEKSLDHLRCHLRVFVNVLCVPYLRVGIIVRVREKKGAVVERRGDEVNGYASACVCEMRDATWLSDPV
jgi:hypothetical protein